MPPTPKSASDVLEIQPVRSLPLFAAIIIAVAITGLAVGLGGTTSAWTQPVEPLHGELPVGVLPAVRYADMDGKQRGPNRDYHSHLTTLLSFTPALFDPVKSDPKQRATALALRASRRAYDGAPPTIPHAVNGNDVSACFLCHGDGKNIDGRIATRISHQHLTNCTQCHAQAGTVGMGPEFPVENHFIGRTSPTHGTRAYVGAPPTIPHATWMRVNCTSCHGLNGREGMRSSHPWRVNCIQCHSASADLEGRDFSPVGNDGPSVPPLIDRTPR